MYNEVQKTEENFMIKKLIHYNNVLILLYKYFPCLSIFLPSLYILAFRVLGLHFYAPIWVGCALRSFFWHHKSTFRKIKNLRCKKTAPAIMVAFLTLMTLKLENKEICVKLTPNDQIDMKKLSKFEFSSVWPLIWPFRPSSAFYNFFEILGT